MDDKSQLAGSLIRDHRRQWRRCLYVYPVISRRSRGMSVGVNLNPARNCNFNCVYCQVDRSCPRNLDSVNLNVVEDELALAMEEIISGKIWDDEKFRHTPAHLRRINDIAFSGDGEPTLFPEFSQAVEIAAKVKRKFNASEAEIVVITNATNLTAPAFTRSLPTLDENNGRIWAKLDAGTQDYFEKINQPARGISLEKITDGIIRTASRRTDISKPACAVIIQTLLMKVSSQPMPASELDAYCNRVKKIVEHANCLEAIHLHTIARKPSENFVSPLDDAELNRVSEKVRLAASEIPVEIFHSSGAAPRRSKEVQP